MRELYEPLGMSIDDYVVADITDEVGIEQALEGVDGVVHTAAMVSVDPAMAETMYHTNVTGTKLVIGGAVKKGIRSIVYTSSLSTLFDTGLTLIDEQTPLAKQTNAYARSKTDCEHYVRELIANGAKIAITIPAAIIGPDDPLLSEANMGLSLYLKIAVMRTSTGQQQVDVRDLATVQRLLLEQNKVGLYLVGGHYQSWPQFAKTLSQAIGKPVRQLPVPGFMLRATGRFTDLLRRFRRIDFPMSAESMDYVTRWVPADDRKVREELNFQYRPSIETLRDTVTWLQNNGHIAAVIDTHPS
jgi:nucleoside-diphosphate-sugar epimerase